MAVTAEAWRRQASAQITANPVATAETWGKMKATAPAPMVETSKGHSRLITTRAGLTSGSEDCILALASSVPMPGEASLRRPTQAPGTPARIHQPAATGTTSSSPLELGPATDTPARALAAAALIRHGV